MPLFSLPRYSEVAIGMRTEAGLGRGLAPVVVGLEPEPMLPRVEHHHAHAFLQAQKPLGRRGVSQSPQIGIKPLAVIVRVIGAYCDSRPETHQCATAARKDVHSLSLRGSFDFTTEIHDLAEDNNHILFLNTELSYGFWLFGR